MTLQVPIPTSRDPGFDSGHRFDEGRRWAASIELAFGLRSVGDFPATRLVRSRHFGPLRVQKPFYPEGRHGCCHTYLLHPPGGLVSGDTLNITAEAQPGAQVLLTTPAAAKLYKADSHGVAWAQHTKLTVAEDAVLEWLPQETIAFDGSRGLQTTTIDLNGNARCLGWEVLALGRPASRLPYVSGHLEQRFRLERDGQPLWLERQSLDPHHPRFQGYWGQGGSTVQATLWATGLTDPVAAVEAVRHALPAGACWAVSQRRGVLLLRYLGNHRNQAWDLCQSAWETLRPLLTGKPASVPRIWMT